jgi:integral membrane sensor domain MASE1
VTAASRSDETAILPVAIGTSAWLVVLVVLILMRGTLEQNGTTWWIGAAFIGLLSGSIGLLFLRWRAKRRRA